MEFGACRAPGEAILTRSAGSEIDFTRINGALVEKAHRVLSLAEERKLSIVTAESCTGGLIAAVLSEAPGAGEWLHGDFVTYTKENKIAALGLDPEVIERQGLVSEAVARAMAEGALSRAGVDLAIAVTGIAGPGGATPTKPVGLVYLAVARRDGPTLAARELFAGDRRAVRVASVEAALTLALAALDQSAAASG
jgi:nicotinamide-nucleotide amidase